MYKSDWDYVGGMNVKEFKENGPGRTGSLWTGECQECALFECLS